MMPVGKNVRAARSSLINKTTNYRDDKSMNPLIPRLRELLTASDHSGSVDGLTEKRLSYAGFTIFMAAISSPVIGLLHLGQWFGYTSTVHAYNCFLFAAFQVGLLFYFNGSVKRYTVVVNLLLASLFLIFASNLVYSVNESMRMLWFIVFLTVAQGLGGRSTRLIAIMATLLLFLLYLGSPLFAPNLTSTEIISSLLMLSLVVILFDYYDYTIQQIMGQLEAAKKEAVHMAGVKSRFLSNMSHEIRTPLNGIIGFTEMLLKEEDKPEKAERLNYIRSSGNVLAGLIGNILDLSKIDNEKMLVERCCCELRNELEAVKIFYVSAQEKGQIFSINISDEVPRFIVCDSLRLNQVLNNLVNNAIKFTQSSGTISLTVSPSQNKGRLYFEVEDNGPGIPQEKQQHIFTPFMQLDESVARQYGGTGLGLSISHHLLQLMGSTLQLQSSEGQGSRFFFELPYEACQGEPHEAPVTPTTQQEIGAARVLVVDDDKLNQVLMKDFLSRLGHQTTVVDNGQEALDAVAKERFDIILMDISMPVMGGVEATERLRDMGIDIPIIALTANIFKEDVDRYLASGMDYCVAKPVNIDALERLIHTYFKGGK
jgi:signal transduction histidine kinase/CheY-like chemotaxis protein